MSVLPWIARPSRVGLLVTAGPAAPATAGRTRSSAATPAARRNAAPRPERVWTSASATYDSCAAPMRTPARLYVVAVAIAALTLALPGSALASKQMLLGLFDDASTYGAPATTFPLLEQLHVQVVRLTLTWGGRDGVANDRPAHPNDP